MAHFERLNFNIKGLLKFEGSGIFNLGSLAHARTDPETLYFQIAKSSILPRTRTRVLVAKLWSYDHNCRRHLASHARAYCSENSFLDNRGEEFAKLNFEVCFKINELQNSKPQPYYELTKNGKITVRVEELSTTP